MAKHISIKKTGSKIAYAGVFSEKHGRFAFCQFLDVTRTRPPVRDYLAEYDTYINRREREHYDSLEYGCDDNSAPPDFNWEAIHDLIDWRSQTYFS